MSLRRWPESRLYPRYDTIFPALNACTIITGAPGADIRNNCISAAVPMANRPAVTAVDGAHRLCRARAVDRARAHLPHPHQRAQLRIRLGDRTHRLRAGTRPGL